MAMPAGCACTTTVSQTSTVEPSSSAAAASRPTYRCAPNISGRWSVAPRYAGPRTIRATACAWPWPSAPCPGAKGGCHATPISADWGNFAPRELTDRSNRLSYPYGVMINRRGRRFVDEGEDGAMFTYAKYGRAILAEPGAKAYQIFDSQVVHLLEPRHATSEPITADTLEDLVAQLDIDDKAQAIHTLREYNAAAKHPADGFDPTQKDGLATSGLAIEKTNWATKLENPPYYAYSATGGITFTFGGQRVDENTQVTVPTGGRSAASSPAGRWSAASFTTITRPAPASFPAPPLAASPAAPRRSSIRPAAHDLRLDQS
jgi:hypothetical protein